MYRNWKAQNQLEPELQYFLNESDGYLNKRSQKTGANLQHKDTFYSDDAAFIFLTKEDLINAYKLHRNILTKRNPKKSELK